jgi:hypothetical protein
LARSLVPGEFKAEMVCLDADAQARGTCGQAEYGPKFGLAYFVEPPLNAQVDPLALVGDQGRWWRVRHD